MRNRKLKNIREFFWDVTAPELSAALNVRLDICCDFMTCILLGPRRQRKKKSIEPTTIPK